MAMIFSKKTIWIFIGVFLVVVPVTVIIARSVTPSTMRIIGDSSKPVNTGWFGIAIKGYDTVAYHTEGRALKGKNEFSFQWNDAKWLFASAANRDLFAADPERYAPQYGGYWAASLAATGKVGGADPEAFKIIDGKLYLNFNRAAADIFAAKANNAIATADRNWEKQQK